MTLRRVLVIATFLWAPLLAAQQAPVMPLNDRVRIAEAFRLAAAVGDGIWPRWSAAPFAVLLVTPEYEFLVRHPSPTSDFTLIGFDSVLAEKVWYRKRHFPVSFLATFPAVGNVPTIVVGEAENTTAKTSTPWVVTLLHEHFHQYQYSHPGYNDSVVALGLAHGDQTGMWMLNFPFPYADTIAQARFAGAGAALRRALNAPDTSRFDSSLTAFRRDMDALRSTVGAEPWRYFEFQFWQEGIARYTEIRVAQHAAAGYQPGAGFRSLKDFTPYSEVSRSLLMDLDRELGAESLGSLQRIVVYNFGAAEGLALDLASPQWRDRYFTPMFTMDTRFPPAR